MSAKLLSRLLLLPLLPLAIPLGARDAVRLVGSDLLGETLRPRLEAAAAERGWDLRMDFGGSLSGDPAVRTGAAEIALLALPRDNPAREGVRAWPFAFEVTTVVVNGANPVRELTLDQLRSLYAEPSGPQELNWGTVGGQGPWAARPVTLHAVRERGRLSLELFKATVLGPREMRVNVRYWDSPAAMAKQIGEDTTAIGLYPREASQPQVRSLFLSLGEGSQAYNATPQSIYYGDYPLRLPYYLVMADDASPAAREVVRFLLTDEVAEALEALGYKSAPAPERQQAQMDLDFGAGS
jgi:hypothetical protein